MLSVFQARKSSYSCPACATIKTAQSNTVVSVKSDDTKLASKSEAVRHFALTIAEKILNDYEINNTAPYMVDKIIRILIKESRSMPAEL